MIDEGEGVAARCLANLGIDGEIVRNEIQKRIGHGTGPVGSPPFTPRSKKVLELSLREALQLRHNYIGTEHILLGLVREGEGVGARVLVDLGVDLERVREEVKKLLSGIGGPLGHATGESVTGRVSRGNRIMRTGHYLQVIRAGRMPDDYAGAFAELRNLASRQGLDLDAAGSGAIEVWSVDTDEGPGLHLILVQDLDDGLDEAGGEVTS